MQNCASREKVPNRRSRTRLSWRRSSKWKGQRRARSSGHVAPGRRRVTRRAGPEGRRRAAIRKSIAAYPSRRALRSDRHAGPRRRQRSRTSGGCTEPEDRMSQRAQTVPAGVGPGTPIARSASVEPSPSDELAKGFGRIPPFGVQSPPGNRRKRPPSPPQAVDPASLRSGHRRGEPPRPPARARPRRPGPPPPDRPGLLFGVRSCRSRCPRDRRAVRRQGDDQTDSHHASRSPRCRFSVQ